jgi:tRNA A22 N-methylase
MRKNNSEIINKVKNIVNEKKMKLPNNNSAVNTANETSKDLNKWIKDNAEKIAKEIIKEEVKKVFK